MVNIRINVSNLTNVEALARRLTNPTSLYESWANYTEGLAVQAFKTETAPFGTAWAPLNSRYAAYKEGYAARERKKAKQAGATYRNRLGNPRGGGRLKLRWTGQLYDSIYARVEADGVVAGANRPVIAAVHQFGAPRRNIPARPFFPLDTQGEPLPQYRAELERMAIDWLEGR